MNFRQIVPQHLTMRPNAQVAPRRCHFLVKTFKMMKRAQPQAPQDVSGIPQSSELILGRIKKGAKNKRLDATPWLEILKSWETNTLCVACTRQQPNRMIGTRINIVVAEIPQQLLTECYKNNNNSRKFYFGSDERRNVERRTKEAAIKRNLRSTREWKLAGSLPGEIREKETEIKDYCVFNVAIIVAGEKCAARVCMAEKDSTHVCKPSLGAGTCLEKEKIDNAREDWFPGPPVRHLNLLDGIYHG